MLKSAIERLISAYRKDDWADPKGFVVQLGAVLEDYPITIVDQVTHPKTGIQRTCKFPPSIAEVVEACEAAMRPERERQEAVRKAERQAAQDRAQIEECRAFYAGRPTLPTGAATHSELCRRYGVRDIPSGLDAVDVAKLAHKHGAGLQAYFDGLNARPSMEVARETAQQILDRHAAEAQRQHSEAAE